MNKKEKHDLLNDLTVLRWKLNLKEDHSTIEKYVKKLINNIK